MENNKQIPKIIDLSQNYIDEPITKPRLKKRNTLITKKKPQTHNDTDNKETKTPKIHKKTSQIEKPHNRKWKANPITNRPTHQ